uniref:Pre-mRNA-splicing factor SPF27 n=1 Tax=Macrostomum lignano TaxID=282301 RepID=A0A1I8F759_9PLAT
ASTKAGVREAALGMVEEEMRRYRPTKNYFGTPAAIESSSVLRPIYCGELKTPANWPPDDVQSWRDSVDNSRAQLEHQSVRIENLQTAACCSRIRCLALSQRHSGGMVAETERRLQATRKACKLAKRLHTFEDTWVHLVR